MPAYASSAMKHTKVCRKEVGQFVWKVHNERQKISFLSSRFFAGYARKLIIGKRDICWPTLGAHGHWVVRGYSCHTYLLWHGTYIKTIISRGPLTRLNDLCLSQLGIEPWRFQKWWSSYECNNRIKAGVERYRSLPAQLPFLVPRKFLNDDVFVYMNGQRERQKNNIIVDWFDSVSRRIGNISAIKRRRLLVKCDQFWNFEVSLAALTSLLFIEIQHYQTIVIPE